MESIVGEVVELYTTQRLSVQQIPEKLSISGYKIRKMLREKDIPSRSISEAITFHHITKFGLKEFSLKEDLSRKDELLKVAGMMLYWGEGYKRGNVVALSNSDPELVKVFLRFLRNICGVVDERIHIAIHYYEDQSPKELTKFWSLETKVPKSQFYKPILHVRKRGTYRAPSLYGTVVVQYADNKLLRLILGVDKRISRGSRSQR